MLLVLLNAQSINQSINQSIEKKFCLPAFLRTPSSHVTPELVRLGTKSRPLEKIALLTGQFVRALVCMAHTTHIDIL